MKAVCIETYYDKELHRTIGKGEEVEMSEKRFKELSGSSNAEKRPLVAKAQAKTTAKAQKSEPVAEKG